MNLKNLLETNSKKVENFNSLSALCENLKEQIKSLENDKEKLKIDYEEQSKSKEIKNEIKYTENKR